MKPLHRNIRILIVFELLITGPGYFLYPFVNLSLFYYDIVILSLLFSTIVLVSLTIFFKGQAKGPEGQVLYSMVSLILKFLLELILALVWFIVAKKTCLISVIIFFVLYLSLTLFSVLVILKTLKNKSL